MAETQFNGATDSQTAAPPVPLTAEPAAPVKRGPGRPRKNPLAATPVKRGPGRPRKDGTVKRGPGRPRKNKAEAVKKTRRVAGVKAQTQIPKQVMKFFMATAKEQGVKASSLLRDALISYATRRGVELGA